MTTPHQDDEYRHDASPVPVFDAQACKGTALAEAHIQRAIAEVQGALVIAQRFPRNPVVARDRIVQSFMDTGLAETAQYQYARGGSNVSGPSIRAAEAIAQSWGNFQFGWHEVDATPTESTVITHAWDLETNTRSVREFQVPHERHTKSKPPVALTDPRDKYENMANHAARRTRACILALIPKHVVDAAMRQADATLRANLTIDDALIKNMVEKFESIGVSKDALEQRIQRRLNTITPALVLSLRKIYNSISDGMSYPADWFSLAPAAIEDAAGANKTATVAGQLAAKRARTRKPESEPAVASETAPPAETTDDTATIDQGVTATDDTTNVT